MTIFKLGNSGGAPGPEQNICFMNSVLFLLFSVTAIRDFFKEKIYKGKGHGRQKTLVCDEVSSIFNCIGARTSAGALRQLMRSMSPKFEYIGNGQQQGAPEFMEDLLEIIEIELKDAGNAQNSNKFRKLYEGQEIRGDRIYSDSIRIRIFFLESRIFTTCVCHYAKLYK